jgi:transcriptional regulator with XRE-family HTH domain
LDIGHRIREVREDLGMQAAVLARRVEVAPNTIYRIEAGDRTPSVALVEKIARELRTEPAEFFRVPVPLADAPSQAGHHEMRLGSSDESEEGLPPTIHYVNGAVDQLLEQLVHDGMDRHRALVLVGKRVEERLAEETV